MNKQEIEKALEFINDLMGDNKDDLFFNNKIGETIKIALAQQLNGRWISVSERLPEKDGNYWVTVKNLTGYEALNSETFECCYAYGEWNFPGWQDNKVIAWQSLPEPYKEEPTC